MWTLFAVLVMVLSASFLVRELAEGRTSHLRSVADALVSGLLAVVVFLVFESVADKEETGIAAAFLFCAAGNATVVRRYPPSFWYSGMAINLPLWCLMRLGPEPVQSEHFVWGLAVVLAGAYIGAFIGAYTGKSNPCSRSGVVRLFHRAAHGHS